MRFQKQKGLRLHRYFIWYSVSGLWYVEKLRKWMPQEDARKYGHGYSSTCRCKTIKAFKRHIKRHRLNKHEVHLVNKYVGYDVTYGQKTARGNQRMGEW